MQATVGARIDCGALHPYAARLANVNPASEWLGLSLFGLPLELLYAGLRVERELSTSAVKFREQVSECERETGKNAASVQCQFFTE